MKRLLVYLFIVLGLGLTFNVNAEEVIYAKKLQNWTTKGNFEGILKNNNQVRGITKIKRSNNAGVSIWVGTYYTSGSGHNFHKGYWKHSYNDTGDQLAHYVEYNKSGDTLRDVSISINDFNKAIKYIKLDLKLPFNFKKNYTDKRQIAKVKPNEMKTIGNSQVEKLSIDNQKLKFCVDDRVKNTYSPYINTSNSECGGYTKKTNFAKYIEWKFRWNFERISDFQKTEKELFQIVKDTLVRETERYGLNKSEIEKFISNSKYSKFETQTAKKVTANKYIVKVTHCQHYDIVTDKLLQYSRSYNNYRVKDCKRGPSNKKARNISHKAALALTYNQRYINKKNKNHFNYCFKPNVGTIFPFNTEQFKSSPTFCSDNMAIKLDYDGKDYFYYSNKKSEYAYDTSSIQKKDTKLTKKEEKKKQTKKAEKKLEVSQEEFKPKKTNQDKDPPIIEVAENITVSDSAYEIKGNVKDKSKKIFIEVDGQTIPVQKGKFKLKRFSPVDEQIKIVAIDQWGNRSKPKIVNVTIDIKNIEVAEKIEPLNPTKMRSRKNKDRIALIIGIEKYDQIPSASYANLDAKFFYEYARKGFGISKSNIKLLIDEDADLVKSLGTLNKWLPGKIKSGQTELIIFFAGHGLASNDGKELYILPQDSDPDLLDRTALSRTELFKEIINLNPKSVTMFMDTCYSGISRDEKMLLASARPVRIVANEEEGIPDNFTIFSASQLDQISSGIKEAKHGIFSYYLMKGLEGKADSNNDKKITNGELLAYMDEKVSQKAAELGRTQNPSLAGDPDRVLINYR